MAVIWTGYFASLTGWEFETRDSRAPVENPASLQVFVCVIEGAVVHRINGHIAVIAPAIGGACLATGAVEKMLFT